MKISNEVKVGAVALVTIVVFIWLFNFLKGKDFFKKTVNYYSVYDEIGGLAESSPVEINGYKVGVVQSIDFIDAETGRLLVVFSVNRDFRLPVNTAAEIVPVSIIAGMKVQFVYGNGPGFYEYGDTIPGRLSAGLLSKLETELMPVKDRVSELISVLDSVISSVNDIMDPEFKKNLNGTVANLNTTSASISNIIGSREKELKESVENLTRFTQMLSNSSGEISNTFNNLSAISDTLAAADIYSSILNLKSALENTSSILGDINKGKGSAGQLLTNDSLYNNISHSLASLDELLKDLKANPKRYVHFSIFGKKNIPAE
jgi:phospholipid/cholesterol/gamma-HCH transport system substrate-binding protein